MSDVQQKATREEIEKRAYQLFEERGCGDGHALEDWIDPSALMVAINRPRWNTPIPRRVHCTGTYMRVSEASPSSPKTSGVSGARSPAVALLSSGWSRSGHDHRTCRWSPHRRCL
jgi:hypothetical protein